MRALVLALSLLVVVGPLPAGHASAASTLPDLTVVDAYINGTLEEGSSNGFQAAIHDEGPATPSAFVVRFQIDDSWQSDQTMPAGFSGDGGPYAPDRWIATAGWHTFTVTVDATGAVEESNEANNVYSYVFQVQPATPPPPPNGTRETIYHWQWYPGAADALETTTVTVPADYAGVWYDLQCRAATTLQVYLDGNLMAACVDGVRVETYPDGIPAGDHVFGVVYLGAGPATVDVTGVRAG